MAVKKAVKKTVKKAVTKKGDEPVRAGRAPSGAKGKLVKVGKYKQALKNSSISSSNRNQYDYEGQDSEGGVYESKGNSGFGKTKSFYRDTYGAATKKMPNYHFPITYHALQSKLDKADKAKAKKKKAGK